AHCAAGFGVRLTGDGGNDATAVPIYEDDRIIVNLSVWESIEALRAFTYSGAHLEVYKERRDWFSHMKEGATAMWWVPAGHVPDVAEAREPLGGPRGAQPRTGSTHRPGAV